jgi:tRNA (guanine37-N1)-methyltransferase
MSQQSKSHGRKSISANSQPRALMTQSPQLAGVWTAQILTLFPEAFPGVLGESLTGRALKDGKWALDTIDLRLFGEGKHRNVDDTPAGGGAGMVLKPNVAGAALDRALAERRLRKQRPALGQMLAVSRCYAGALRALISG